MLSPLLLACSLQLQMFDCHVPLTQSPLTLLRHRPSAAETRLPRKKRLVIEAVCRSTPCFLVLVMSQLFSCPCYLVGLLCGAVLAHPFVGGVRSAMSINIIDKLNCFGMNLPTHLHPDSLCFVCLLFPGLTFAFFSCLYKLFQS